MIYAMCFVTAILLLGGSIMGNEANAAERMIGYTEHCTSLPGGRAANVFTMRACVVKSDGTGRREVAPYLATNANTWTQFAGWSPDSKWVYFTAKVGEAVELMRASLAGVPEQLTHSKSGVRHYHQKVSADGAKVVFGATRDGVRQLWVSRADGTKARAVTSLKAGRAAMWPSWQP